MTIPTWRRALHWVILLVYGFVVINGGAAAIRGIVIDTSEYRHALQQVDCCCMHLPVLRVRMTDAGARY